MDNSFARFDHIQTRPHSSAGNRPSSRGGHLGGIGGGLYFDMTAAAALTTRPMDASTRGRGPPSPVTTTATFTATTAAVEPADPAEPTVSFHPDPDLGRTSPLLLDSTQRPSTSAGVTGGVERLEGSRSLTRIKPAYAPHSHHTNTSVQGSGPPARTVASFKSTMDSAPPWTSTAP